MAKINFPDSPTDGQEFVLNDNVTYVWDDANQKWDLVVQGASPSTVAPTITEVEEGDGQVTFTITNNDEETAVITYEVSIAGDDTPDEFVLELASGATSSNLTVTGLTNSQAYIIYARAIAVGKVLSEPVFITSTPQPPPPTYLDVTATTTTSRAITGVRFYENKYYPMGSNNTNYGSETSFHTTDIIALISPSPVTITFSSITGFAWINLYKADGTTNGHYAYRTDIAGRIGTIQQTLTFPANTAAFTVGVCSYQHPSYNMPNAISFANFSNLTMSYTIDSGVETGTYEVSGTFYKYHAFKSSGTFTVNSLSNQAGFNDIEYVIVAGGGGGGSGYGGGGAGGYLSSVEGEASGGGTSALSKVTVTTQSYPIIVGAGGASGQHTAPQGLSGGNSSAFGLTSIGGGWGSGSNTGGAGSGGSGGSPGWNGGGGGAGTVGQGFAGNSGTSSHPRYGGSGGGGAGAQGGLPNYSENRGGHGGIGVASSITGTSTYRAGGGGGGIYIESGGYTANYSNGGLGGGGRGGASGGGVAQGQLEGLAGTINTGGGGGSIAFGFGSGGSGIVIIRYKVGEL